MSSCANIMLEMATSKECQIDLNYQKYLTEKLDSGEPNVVVDSVIELVKNDQQFKNSNIRIADFGCFTGSIINRVYFSLPNSLRKNVSLFGFDYDTNTIKKASLLRPLITFSQYDLTEAAPKTEPFHIGILSNVLHEVYSLKVDNKKEAKKLVINSLKNMQSMLNSGGFLVILDGILPNRQDKIIDIDFLHDDVYLKFIQFANSGYCIKIPYETGKDRIIKTTVGSLANFFVKSRYLETTFWEQESRQVYNYFTKEDFKKVLLFCGFTIEKQYLFGVPNINEKVKIFDNSVQTPFKNTLIIARKRN